MTGRAIIGGCFDSRAPKRGTAPLGLPTHGFTTEMLQFTTARDDANRDREPGRRMIEIVRTSISAEGWKVLMDLVASAAGLMCLLSLEFANAPVGK